MRHSEQETDMLTQLTGYQDSYAHFQSVKYTVPKKKGPSVYIRAWKQKAYQAPDAVVSGHASLHFAL